MTVTQVGCGEGTDRGVGGAGPAGPSGIGPGAPGGTGPAEPSRTKPGAPSKTKPGTPSKTKPTEPRRTKPGTPSKTKPFEPANPAGTKPAEPTEPTAPTEPTEPTAPTEPTEPTEPTAPTGPTAPTAPTATAATAEPARPARPARPAAPTPAPAAPRIRVPDLVRAGGGPRYAVALAVDALGTGLLRPFLLLYGITVLKLSAPAAGAAMTAGIVVGLAAMPGVGRWLDRGARSAVVAASMLVRVIGTVLLLGVPAGEPWLFAASCLFLGVGNQAWPAAHAALVATVAEGRARDAALAAARSLRNGGMGVGALIAMGAMTGGAGALRLLAAGTGVGYLLAAALAGSVRIRGAAVTTTATMATGPAAGSAEPTDRMSRLLAANVVYVFCLNIPEIALPLVLVTQFHAAPAWSAAVFVANTALVVALQVPVTVWMARFPRHTALAIAGVVLAGSYLGFLAATPLGGGWGAPAVAAVSVVCTLGEILYAGSATALVTAIAPPHALGRALARFQISSGFGLAVSPAVVTALAAVGPAALWGTLAVATLAGAAAVA